MPRARSLSRPRSWNSSKTTTPADSRNGSSCSKRSRMPGVTTRMRSLRAVLAVEAHLITDLVAEPAAALGGHAAGGGAGGHRRGSSTTMRPLPARPASSSAGGTRVVLPAPVGRAPPRPARAARPRSRRAERGRSAREAASTGLPGCRFLASGRREPADIAHRRRQGDASAGSRRPLALSYPDA